MKTNIVEILPPISNLAKLWAKMLTYNQIAGFFKL